jgi:COP9 signalosome complex subunit 6
LWVAIYYYYLHLQQSNDVGLMTYLGTITKGCHDINQFVNKFNILYERQGMGRRTRGLFF